MKPDVDPLRAPQGASRPEEPPSWAHRLNPLRAARQAFRLGKSIYLAWRSVPWFASQIHELRSELATLKHHATRRPFTPEVHRLVSRVPADDAPRPLVSVVVPCFEHADTLREALDSVARQSLRPIEVIVVNDCSSDHTNDVVAAFCAANPDLDLRLRVNDRNLGLAASRNLGFHLARARWVFPLDSDNRIAPSCLAEMIEAANDSAAFVTSWIERFGGASGVFRPQTFELRRLRHGNVQDAMALIRRSVWEELGGYDPAMRYGWEDYEFWIRVAKAGHRGIVLPKPLMQYRVAGSSMVHTTTFLFQTELRKVLARKHADVFPDG